MHWLETYQVRVHYCLIVAFAVWVAMKELHVSSVICWVWLGVILGIHGGFNACVLLVAKKLREQQITR